VEKNFVSRNLYKNPFYRGISLHVVRISVAKSATLLLVLVLLSSLCLIVPLPVMASSDFWVERAPMPSASSYVRAVEVNGEIYAISPNSTYVYDPSTDTWTPRAPMLKSEYGFAIANYHDMIYVIGGCAGFDEQGFPTNCTGTN